MLALKPNCEWCDIDLPAESEAAYICSYECTFCQSCVDSVLQNVCPNCGGGFSKRPVRPKTPLRPGVSLQNHPASTKRVLSSYTLEQVQEFSQIVLSQNSNE